MNPPCAVVRARTRGTSAGQRGHGESGGRRWSVVGIFQDGHEVKVCVKQTGARGDVMCDKSVSK